MKSKRLQLEGGRKHKLKLNGVALLEQAEQSPPSTPDEAIAVLKAYYPFLSEKDPDFIEFDSANTIEIIKDFYSTGKLRLRDYMIKETTAITTKK